MVAPPVACRAGVFRKPARPPGAGGVDEDPKNDYEIIKAIGKGKFAVVYRARCRRTGDLVALKAIALSMDADAKAKTLKEVRLLEKLEHPNIVKYLRSYLAGDELIIAFEWAAAGDLKQQIRRAQERGHRFNEQTIWKFIVQISQALVHMHSQRILHRDLKPANIFLTSQGKVKVGDLGLGRFLSEHTLEAHSKVGTPLYMSPEVLKGSGYDFKCDVWALGCVLYELAMLRSPFKPPPKKYSNQNDCGENKKMNLYTLFQRIATADYDRLPDDVYSKSLRDLVARTLSVDPAGRPDVRECRDIAEAMKRALKRQTRPECEPPPPSLQPPTRVASPPQQQRRPTYEVLDLSEGIVEKLAVLGYQRDRRIRGLDPVPRLRFAYDDLALTRRSSRLFDVADAVRYVGKLLGNTRDAIFLSAAAAQDAPFQAATAIVAVLRDAGYNEVLLPQDILCGAGLEVCRGLNFLADRGLQRSFAYLPPDYSMVQRDPPPAEEIITTEDSDPESSSSIMSAILVEPPEFGFGTPRRMLTTAVDPKEWFAELDRVKDRLRVPIVDDDWRDRYDVLQKIPTFDGTAVASLGAALRTSCDSIRQGEAHLDAAFPDDARRYAAKVRHSEDLARHRDERFDTVRRKINDLSTLDTALTEIHDRPTVTDASHILKIRADLATLQSDVRNLDLAIGVHAHRLWKLQISQKTHPSDAVPGN